MAEFNPNQKIALEQHLVLLKTFVETSAARVKPRFKEGQLTIVDLSDPFVDPGSACSLFEIITCMFVRAEVDTGKVLVVDEAHKYLSVHRGTTGLMKALTSLIRQQRHLAMRVIISTQEPTALPPVLIDLCSVAILHGFSSPAWWEAIVKHVSADFSSDDDAFDHVVKLKTGEAVILAPSGLGKFPSAGKMFSGDPELTQFGRRYLLARTRRRVTADGGQDPPMSYHREKAGASLAAHSVSGLRYALCLKLSTPVTFRVFNAAATIPAILGQRRGPCPSTHVASPTMNFCGDTPRWACGIEPWQSSRRGVSTLHEPELSRDAIRALHMTGNLPIPRCEEGPLPLWTQQKEEKTAPGPMDLQRS
ncbi:hypothetical protein OH76DRAFT_1479404 [Lentinus brumalis]|uniref:Uncharacterized protein n=1 Tax=Lentinus brumalis TaxID=2498619 RepID=A0A371DM46_9APHY|nr:hypothetical protein OH76DRAFT_1479404 [Polyporus brumalis]